MFRKIPVLLLSSLLIFNPLILVNAQEGVPVSFPEETPTEEAPQEEVSVTAKRPDLFEEIQEDVGSISRAEFDEAVNKSNEELSKEHVEDYIIVNFKDAESADTVVEEIAPDEVVAQRFTKPLGENVRLVRIPDESTKLEQMVKFNLEDSVESVEVNEVVKKSAWTVDNGLGTAKPNDYNNTNHFYHTKTKLPETYHTQGCAAGMLCGGKSGVTVAILDTGVAFENNAGAWYREYTGGGNFVDRSPLNFSVSSELNGMTLYQNVAEDYGGGDEDGNQICDDVHGVDFMAWLDNLALLPTENEWQTQCDAGTGWVVKEGHPNDDDGHGTYIAAMIAGLTDNNANSFGASFKVTVMPIKVLDYFGIGSTVSLAYGIYYAVDHGAQIINMSIAGLTSPSSTIETALIYAETNNVLVVAASGNQNLSSVEYPAGYSATRSNVISVGAIHPSGSEPSVADDTKSTYSSYGTALDMVAPVGNSSSAGIGTWSQTYQDQGSWGATPLMSRNFTTFSTQFGIGTSFAAPQVTAAAVMLRSRSDLLSAEDIKNLLITTAQDVTSSGVGRDNQTGHGALNVKDAWDEVGTNGFWFPWVANGGTNGEVFNGTLGTRLFQGIVTNGIIYTRSTTGSTDINGNPIWASWAVSGGSTTGKVYFASSNNRIYQVVVANGVIWTRYHVSGNVDGGSVPIWSSFEANGGTGSDIFMFDLSGRLFQSIVANGVIWTRSIDNTIGSPVWTSWVAQGGSTTNKIFFGGSNGKIYQSVVANGVVWTRYHTSGNVDGGSVPIWGGFISNGGTSGDVDSATLGSRFFQSVVTGGVVWTRTTTGTLDGSNNPIWTNWISNGGTNGRTYFGVSDGKLYQSAITGGKIWTRYTDGTLDGGGNPAWSAWIESREASTEIRMADLNDRLFQATTHGGTTWTRTTDGTLNGAFNPIWTGWLYSGGTSGKIYMVSSNNKIYQSIVTNGVIYTRYFTN